ncbi:MAG: hypothetical protein IJ757_09485 [Clostridiales bacterium]|nr:hypothetical protein [Clostridiales bacterium]
MRYYIANLAVHVVVMLALIVIIIVFSDRNRKRKTKHAITYFVPTVAAVIAAFYLFKITGPRLLDLSDVATQNYYSYTGQIEEISPLNNSFLIDGDRYYINPLRDLPEAGEKVRIRYTRYSNYVISVEAVDELDINGVINEQMETAVDIPD